VQQGPLTLSKDYPELHYCLEEPVPWKSPPWTGHGYACVVSDFVTPNPNWPGGMFTEHYHDFDVIE